MSGNRTEVAGVLKMAWELHVARRGYTWDWYVRKDDKERRGMVYFDDYANVFEAYDAAERLAEEALEGLR